MKTLALPLTRAGKVNFLLDFIAIGFIYLIPTLSHLLNVPLYLIEPMRLMVILAMVHTQRNNAYLLALTLPFFSYLVSGHPIGLKTTIIAIELILNVWIYYRLTGILKSSFLPMFIAIISSKIIYYLMKAGLISLVMINTSLFSTPLLIQIIVTFILSTYVYFWLRKTNS